MDEVSKEIIEKAQRHQLDLNEESLEFVNIGLDFQVVIAADKEGQEWMLRIPRREDALLKVQNERKILSLVNRWTGTFQVPVWVIFSEELVAYKKLDGTPAVTTDPKSQENIWAFDEKNIPETFTQSLGKALASLHAIPKEEVREAGLSIQSAADLKESMKKRIETVRKNYEVNEKLVERWKKWLEDEEIWPKKTGFIHGDLYPGHTLVNKEYIVTGIIDWTEAKISDIANDFTAHYLLFGEKELEKLIKSYEEAGGYTWPKMKEHIIELLSTQAITIAEFALSSGLNEYEQMAKDLLKDEK